MVIQPLLQLERASRLQEREEDCKCFPHLPHQHPPQHPASTSCTSRKKNKNDPTFVEDQSPNLFLQVTGAKRPGEALSARESGVFSRHSLLFRSRCLRSLRLGEVELFASKSPKRTFGMADFGGLILLL